MPRKPGEAGLWLVRFLVAAAVGLAALPVFSPRHDDDDADLPATVQAGVVRAFREELDDAVAGPRPRYTLVFFGDSFVLPENLLSRVQATPMQLRRQLGTAMRNAGAGEPADLRLIPLEYSGLSQWSLYYLTDSIVDLHPEYVVVEFNLFNFSDFWSRRDRKILSALLPLSWSPEALRLPLGRTGLTMDEWIFGRLALRLGAVPWWEAVQEAQVHTSEWHRSLEDAAQQLAGAPPLEFRAHLSLLRLADTRETARDRSTRKFSEQMLGRSLAGVDPEAPALQMLAASLERLRSAGIPVMVYVPPYNVEHLKELGLMEGSRLGETIARVRETAERSGARFHDAHALLGDAYFRDAMDHLHEGGDFDGHRAVAVDLARAMSDDWQRILAAHR